MVAHAGAHAAAPRRRAPAARGVAPTRRCRAPAAPASTSSTSRSARSPTAPPRSPSTATRSTSPSPTKFAAPIAFNVLPLAGSIVDDGSDETDEEQKLRNESRKILGIPDLRGVGHLRAGAGVHRPLAVDQRRVRAPDRAATRRTEILAAAPGVVLADVPTPLHGRRRRPDLRRPHPPATPASTAAGASPCSCPATTSARAPRSTRSRSPSCSSRALATREIGSGAGAGRSSRSGGSRAA